MAPQQGLGHYAQAHIATGACGKQYAAASAAAVAAGCIEQGYHFTHRTPALSDEWRLVTRKRRACLCGAAVCNAQWADHDGFRAGTCGAYQQKLHCMGLLGVFAGCF